MPANPEWYYTKDDKQLGPVTIAELKQLAFSGRIAPKDLIWNEKWPDWKAAGSIKGFLPVQKAAVSVPPPLPKRSADSTPPQPPAAKPSPGSSRPPDAKVALWNPFVARIWSLLFTPALGSYLTMLNWKALGDDVRAKRSMLWFYPCSIFVLLAVVTPNTPAVTASFRFIGLIIFVAWACTDSERQVKYVRQAIGGDYMRKPWGKPIGIGLAIFCLAVVIHESPSQTANIAVVQNGKLDAYPGVTVGELVDNFLGNPEWDEITGQNGETFVNAAGRMTLQGKEVQAVIQFTIRGQRFELNAFEMNGTPQPNLMKVALFQRMYEEYQKDTNDTGPAATNSQPAGQITREDYERVREGMTLQQVQAILGTGTEEFEAGDNKTFGWEDGDGNMISVTFNKGRVLVKSRLFSN